MANFGLFIRICVSWRRGPAGPPRKAAAMAAGAASVVDNARVFAHCRRGVVGELNLVFATTARERGIAREIRTTGGGGKVPRLRDASTRDEKNRHPVRRNERAGLDNVDEISLCDAVITVPTAEFASLNLGQAVLVIAELRMVPGGRCNPPSLLEHGLLQRKSGR